MNELAVHPGVVLAEALQDRGLTQEAFALKVGVSHKHVNEICNGHTTYSAVLAVAMERVLGAPNAEFWMALLAAYQIAQARARRG